MHLSVCTPSSVAENVMRQLAFCLLVVSALYAAQGTQTLTGVITDDECGRANHSGMRMGSTDAECTIACIDAHGAVLVLYDGENIYQLSDQQAPERFAGQRVHVTGTVDSATMTIHVDSITAAE